MLSDLENIQNPKSKIQNLNVVSILKSILWINTICFFLSRFLNSFLSLVRSSTIQERILMTWSNLNIFFNAVISLYYICDHMVFFLNILSGNLSRYCYNFYWYFVYYMFVCLTISWSSYHSCTSVSWCDSRKKCSDMNHHLRRKCLSKMKTMLMHRSDKTMDKFNVLEVYCQLADGASL